MATLSLPTNTPTLDGAVVGCTTDDTTGTVYAMVRTDRQWYSVANGDSPANSEADKAVIIAQDITASELVWAGIDADLATIQLTIDGLAARLDPANPYYVGWVHEEAPEPENILVDPDNIGSSNWVRVSISSVDTGLPDAFGGNTAQRINSSVDAPGATAGYFFQTNALPEGTTFKGSLWAKGTGEGFLFKSLGLSPPSETAVTTDPLPTDWTYYEHTGVATAGTDDSRVVQLERLQMASEILVCGIRVWVVE